MKKINPRDYVYTSTAEELRRRYNLSAEDSLSSAEVFYGEKDAWSYEKYSNGRIHIWGVHRVTPSSSTAKGNVWYSNGIYIPVDIGENLEGCVMNITTNGPQYGIGNVEFTDDSVYFRFYSGASAINTSLEVLVYVDMWAKW